MLRYGIGILILTWILRTVLQIVLMLRPVFIFLTFTFCRLLGGRTRGQGLRCHALTLALQLFFRRLGPDVFAIFDFPRNQHADVLVSTNQLVQSVIGQVFRGEYAPLRISFSDQHLLYLQKKTRLLIQQSDDLVGRKSN